MEGRWRGLFEKLLMKNKGGPLNLVFLSGQPHCGPWKRESHDIQAWAAAMEGDTYNSCRLSLLWGIKDYKIALLELRPHNFHLIKQIKKWLPRLKLIGVQEGSLHSPDSDYNSKTRLKFIEAYQNVDALGVLLEDSIPYFQSITDKPVFWLGVPFPVEWSKSYIIPPEKKEPIIEMQNTFSSQKGGLTNFFLLKSIQKTHPEARGLSYSQNIRYDQVLADSFGVNLKIEPMLSWQNYFILHSKAYIGLHMDYRWSWNRFSVDCAAAGIPCISTPHATSHKTLFPKLCVEPFDVESAKGLAGQLLKDRSFYKECREYALNKIELFDFENSKKRLLGFLNKQNWV